MGANENPLEIAMRAGPQSLSALFTGTAHFFVRIGWMGFHTPAYPFWGIEIFSALGRGLFDISDNAASL
jgi:hypothetical protein